MKNIVLTNWRDLKHPQAGGAELVVDELATHFAAEGHSVTLLTAAVAGEPKVEQFHGYTIRRAGGRFTVYGHALAWLLRHRRSTFAVVDSQNGIPFFTPLVTARNTAVVMLLHHIHQDQFEHYFPKPAAAVGRWLEAAGSRLVYRDRAIVAVSPSTRQGARTRLKLKGEIKVVPPGWRLGPAAADRLVERSAHPTNATVGRLVPHKRTALVVEAMVELRRQHPDLVLHVVGGGTELPALQAIVAKHGLQDAVVFHPNCSDDERDEILAAAWLSVNASMGEGWGISVIEANALGTPVLAFDRPGLRDSIRDGETGWLIREGADLAPAVSERLEEMANTAAFIDLDSAVRDWADRFTWPAMARKVLGVVMIERRRLNLSHTERRNLNDVGTLVSIPMSSVPEGWSPALRDGDSASVEGESMVVFLAGSDTAASPMVLRRLGLPDGSGDDLVYSRVARGQDHMIYTGVSGQDQTPVLSG